MNQKTQSDLETLLKEFREKNRSSNSCVILCDKLNIEATISIIKNFPFIKDSKKVELDDCHGESILVFFEPIEPPQVMQISYDGGKTYIKWPIHS